MSPDFTVSYSLDGLDGAVRSFWETAGDNHVFLFHGEMGAGKTTFISALVRYLGSGDSVSSPTFALINEYRFPEASGVEKKIFHMDLYRVRSTEEAIMAGVEDCILQARAQGDYVFAEWPERAPGLFAGECAIVHIDIAEGDVRVLRVTSPHA
jgi:tRNA threonylcarbamoyladenosine biosynthesis protein TsaE